VEECKPLPDALHVSEQLHVLLAVERRQLNLKANFESSLS
jgi:hypothetical protein